MNQETYCTESTLLERARSINFPLVPHSGSAHVGPGEANWRASLSGLPRGVLQQISDGLARLEEDHQRFEGGRLSDEPVSYPTSLDPVADEANRRMLVEAQQRAEYRASTPGRLEAIEGLLREIRDTLQERRR